MPRIAIAFALVCLLPSTTWLGIKVGLEGTSPMVGAGLRFAVAGPCLIALALATRQSLVVPRRAWGHLAAVAVLMFAVPYALIYLGETRIASGLAAVLFGAAPLFVVLIADRARPREPLTATSLVGVLVGMVGLLVVFRGAMSVSSTALDLLAMIGVLAAAVLTAALQVRSRHTATLLPISVFVAWGSTGAGVLLVAAGLALEDPRLAADGRTLGSIAYLGVTAAIGFWCLFWLLGRIGAVYVSLHALVVPVLAVLWGAAFYDEPVTLALGVGAAVVCLGIGLVAGGGIRRHRAARLTPPSERSNLPS